MIRDTARVRRARIAIYGPYATGTLGVLFILGGTVGITRDQLDAMSFVTIAIIGLLH